MAFCPLIGSNLNYRFFELGGHLQIAARPVSQIRSSAGHGIAIAALSGATIELLDGDATLAKYVARIRCSAVDRDGSLVSAGPGRRIS